MLCKYIMYIVLHAIIRTTIKNINMDFVRLIGIQTMMYIGAVVNMSNMRSIILG